MTMINEVLDKLEYLKLKSAYTYLKELHIKTTPLSLKMHWVVYVIYKDLIK